MTKLRQRLGSEQGFTLIELLVVIVIIGILLAIAVPSYLGFKDRADTRAAQSNVRAAVPAVEAYYSDCGTYANETAATCGTPAARVFDATNLKSDYDQGLAITGSKAVTIESVAGGDSYCISAEGAEGEYWVKAGPGADITGPAGAGC